MTKEEFRKRWDCSPDGGGITFDDIAECAIEWGLFSRPRIHRMDVVANAVTVSAGCEDVFRIWDDEEEVGE